MINKILIISLLLISGCASQKYPNWEKVNIISSADNKPCISKDKTENCNITDTSKCTDWFKKRATLVNANTALIDTNSCYAKYLQCEVGLPPYKENKQSSGLKFIEDDYKSYLKSGNNTVTGQAFLTQNGGGVVTCAGQNVLMYPDTDYFNQRDMELSKGCNLVNEPGITLDLFKTSQCDAQGNFDFNKIPDGKYIVTVNVSWNVYTLRSIGNYYYTDNQKQGGPLRKKIIVKNGEINRFIISR